VAIEQAGEFDAVEEAQVFGLANRFLEVMVVDDGSEVQERAGDGRDRDAAFFRELVWLQG
jgi:hypothetical protein